MFLKNIFLNYIPVFSSSQNCNGGTFCENLQKKICFGICFQEGVKEERIFKENT